MDYIEQPLKGKKEAARYLGVSPGTLERLIRSGLPYIKMSGVNSAVRFRQQDLVEFVESRRRVQGEAA